MANHVEFEMYPMVNAVKSKEAGREVCDEEPHVRIRIPGMDKEEFFGPVNEQIKKEYAAEWEAFQNGQRVAQSGTPIERWPQLTPGQVRMLKNLHIYSVEDMATLSDMGLQKVGMGSAKLRADAQRFLSLAQAAADVELLEGLQEEAKVRDAELKELRETVAAMQRQMEENKPARKPRKQKDPPA